MSEIRVDTISEKTSANGVAVDGVTLKDGGIAATAASTITTADNTDTLTLVSTDTDANIAPVLNLSRNNNSAAANDFVGKVMFTAEDAANNQTSYADIQGVVLDATDGSEDGRLRITTVIAGGNRNRLDFLAGEAVFNEDSQDLDFRVESNGNANMLFVDGGSDHVNIGTATDLGGVLNVAGTAVIQTADNTDTLTLISTDADASSGPNLRLYRNSSSPVNDDVTGVIQFEGRNNNSQDFISSEIKSVTSDVADGTEDGALAFSVMNAGTLQQVAIFTGPEVIFNETSNDIDFRVESNGNTHMLFVDGGANKVGIGESTIADIDATLHVKTSDSGGTFHSEGDELGVESSGSSGISILSGSSSVGNLYFGDSEDNNSGRVVYDHSTNAMILFSNATEALRMSTSQVLSTGAEAAPDTTNGGLTLQTNGEDLATLTFKNTDVAHGQTDGDQTDTFAKFIKHHATVGGLRVQTYSEGELAFKIDGRYTTDNTTKGTGATCPVQIDVRKISGTGVTTPGADANMFSVTNNGQTKFIVDEDGDIHNDGSVTAYDNYEDAQLVRAFDLSHGKGVIDSKFDKFISYNHEALADMKLVGREEDGTPNHFINVTGMQRLHNGAIWQQYEKHQKLASAFYKLATKTIGKEEADKLLTEEEIQLLN